MKALLLPVLLLSLGAALQAQDDPLSFPAGEADITGTWYTQAMVANKEPPNGKRPKTAFPLTVTALEDGSLEIKTTFMFKGRCQEKKMVMHETQTPGKYSTFDGKKTFYVEQLAMKDHCVVYCEDQRKGFRMLKLIGRTPEQNPEALEEFRKSVQHKGLLEENIIRPQQAEYCVPEHD